MDRHRVVITGLGVIAPNASGKEPFWQACLEGRTGVRSITRYEARGLPTRIAGEVRDFSPLTFGLKPDEAAQLDRSTQFALAAANLALSDAGFSDLTLTAETRQHIGVYLGSAMAAIEEGERLWSQLTGTGTHIPRPLAHSDEPKDLLLSYIPAALIAASHQLSGPCMMLSTGCSSGADAIGQAFWLIQEGRTECMLAGGSDACLNALSIDIFSVMHALSKRNDEPERASRPYDTDRDGFVLSEGAAILVLENREQALARQAHIYAEIVAFATNGNAYHMTTLPPDGAPLQGLLQQVLDSAGIEPAQLGYINAHGSSTRSNDIVETIAYKNAFGQQAYHIPISSTKSLIGHAQGAASAIETLITALALDRQILPPTINLDVADPQCDLDYIPNAARPLDPSSPLRFALTHSSGFGGVNTALVLARHQSEPAQPFHAAYIHTTSTSKRVAITGLGAISPVGCNKTAFWEALLTDQAASELLTHYSQLPTRPQLVGTIRDFQAEMYLGHKLLQRTDRMTHLALAAVQEALQDAGLELEQEHSRRVGAVISNTFGGIDYVVQQIDQLYQKGHRALSAYTAIAGLHVANVGQVSVQYGLQGYSKTPVNDTAGGLNALGMAYHAIQRGVADVLLAGGCEAPLHPIATHMLQAYLPLCREAIPKAYRPFDRRASGALLAEGAGICILEEYEHARRRGARIYGEVVGFAQINAPRKLPFADAPDEQPYIKALRKALSEAALNPEDIACVYLDGRALPEWDGTETAALLAVFRSEFARLSCSVPRTHFGHSLAASGAFDTICALLGLQHRLIPPTLHCEDPAPFSCPPGLVRGMAQNQVQLGQKGALVCARSIGGSHVVLALKKV